MYAILVQGGFFTKKILVGVTRAAPGFAYPPGPVALEHPPQITTRSTDPATIRTAGPATENRRTDPENSPATARTGEQRDINQRTAEQAQNRRTGRSRPQNAPLQDNNKKV